MRTGRVICDIPLVSVGDIEQAIGAYSSTSAALPVVDAPDGWEQATMPGAATLVMLSDGVPMWGGFVTSRSRTDGDVVTLGLASIEAYFDRRFVGDDLFEGIAQTHIVRDLVNQYVGDSLTIRVEYSASEHFRNREYFDDEDKSVLSIISELSGLRDGVEWVISWEETESSGQVAYTPVLNVADRLGVDPMPGLAPAVSFDMPGPVTSITLVESFASGDGATDVLATSSADGDRRPQSNPMSSGDIVRPRFEERFTPSTSIRSLSVLNLHASETLARMRDGSVTLALSLNLGEAPPLGIDWILGDRVGFQIGGTDGTVPAFPGGLNGTARVIAWRMSGLDGSNPTITPTLTEVLA
jgi:hypothetical protein